MKWYGTSDPIYNVDSDLWDYIDNLKLDIQDAEREFNTKDITLKKKQEKQKIESSLYHLRNFLKEYPSIACIPKPIEQYNKEINAMLKNSSLQEETKKYIKDQLDSFFV